jgi:hypothetical protein
MRFGNWRGDLTREGPHLRSRGGDLPLLHRNCEFSSVKRQFFDAKGFGASCRKMIQMRCVSI